MNNFFSLVLFSAVIDKRREEKLISKTIKYKLDSSSKGLFFSENYRFFQKSGNDTNIWGRGEGNVLCVIITKRVRKSICDSILTEIIHFLRKHGQHFFRKVSRETILVYLCAILAIVRQILSLKPNFLTTSICYLRTVNFSQQ